MPARLALIYGGGVHQASNCGFDVDHHHLTLGLLFSLPSILFASRTILWYTMLTLYLRDTYIGHKEALGGVT